MPRQYQYVEANGRYYSLRQNPIALAWFLLLKNRPLGIRRRLGKRVAVRTVGTLIQHQLCPWTNRSVLELPVYGHLGLKVHRGYRLFDYRRNAVARVIDPDVDPAVVAAEIKGAQSASRLDFAPKVLRWNVQERWYEEDFVSGHIAHSSIKSESEVFEIYRRDIAPCLEKMILLQDPLTVDLAARIDEISIVFEDGRLSRPELDAKRVNSIRDFVGSTIEQLGVEENRHIRLVFSHGDLALRNILRTRDGITVIDWESAGHRSVLFDLYNYFFAALYYEQITTNPVPEINRAIASLQSRLAAKAPDIARDLPSLARVYRRLYYVERLSVLLEREMSNDLLDVILRSIDVFNRYEKITNDDSSHLDHARDCP
jgi:choline/ethanolamine kinase